MATLENNLSFKIETIFFVLLILVFALLYRKVLMSIWLEISIRTAKIKHCSKKKIVQSKCKSQ